jgi:outer membrane protein OmpA-like peptidoglycan-associated protein
MYNRSMSMKNISSLQQRLASGAIIFSLLLALLAAPPVAAQIRQGAAFLQFTPGAREQGIAGSLTGVIDGVHAVYANPGAAGFLREWQWSATYAQWIADVYSASLIYGKRIRTPWSAHSRFALGLAYQGMADFNSTAQASASVSANDLVAALSFGQPLSRRIAVGANVKYLRSKLAQYEASSWMIDSGILFRSARFRFLNTGKSFLDYGIFSAGIAATELGQSLTFISTATPLPRTFRGGVAFNTGTHNGLQLHFTVDYKKARDQQGFVSFGSEISWSQIFALRGGYDFNDCLLSHFSFGLTLRLDDRNTPTSVLPGRNKAMRFDVAAVEDNFLFSRTYRGSVTHHAIDPEGFDFIGPASGASLKSDSVLLAWQPTKDPDLYDDVDYRLIVDRDSLKLAEAIDTIKRDENAFFNTMENARFFINQNLRGTAFQLTDLEGGDYYWTVMAYDRDRHVRFAGGRNRHIRHFRIVMPDVEVTRITFDYHPWITEDDLQGTLHFIIKNSGEGAAKNVSVTIYDSLAAPTDGAAPNKPMVQMTIPQLQAGASDTLRLEWHTVDAGLHHITARLDEENRLFENDETNNRRNAAFYTIPKGGFAIKNTVAIVDSLNSYEVPFIPEICFDRASSEVKPEYIRQQLGLMNPPLDTLVKRLQKHSDLDIYLKGFADAEKSDEGDKMLAWKRAAAVRQYLLSLSADSAQLSKQIKLEDPEFTPKPKLWPADSDEDWRRQERRFVKIEADNMAEPILFQHVSFADSKKRFVPVTFAAAIKGVVPLREGKIQVKSDSLADRININDKLYGADLMQLIDWNHEQSAPKTENGWATKAVEYDLVLADSLGRQFKTPRRDAHLTAQSMAWKQIVVWPLVFGKPELLYDFYWTKLFGYVDSLLQHPNMRMRIAGHACAIGREEGNMSLSQRRANKLYDAFREKVKRRYLPADMVKIFSQLDPNPEGKGETRPFDLDDFHGDFIGEHNKTPMRRKLNRRLEIEFYYSEKAPTNFTER